MKSTVKSVCCLLMKLALEKRSLWRPALKVYNVLSERLKDTYDIFGNLPDTIDDEWIQDEAELDKRMDVYIHERKMAEDAFSVKERA